MPASPTFRAQAAALFIRSYHWQRRQYCTLACNFVAPPLLLVLLSALHTLFDATDPPNLDTSSRAPFAPAPFRLDACANVTDASLARACRDDPFVPKYSVPFFARRDESASVASRPARAGAGFLSVLGSYSLHPLLYPQDVSGSVQVAQSRAEARDLLLAYLRDESKTELLYAALNQTPARLDEWYGTKTRRFQSRAALNAFLYRSHGRDGEISNAPTSALSFDVVSQNASDGSLSLSLTVLYKQSSTKRSKNPLLATLTRTYSALYSHLRPAGRAQVFLKRVPATLLHAAPGNSMLRVVPAFIGMLTHLLFPSFLKFLVLERVGGMRSMMFMMGLRRRHYAVTTHLALLCQFITSATIIVVVGLVMRLPLFAYNTPLSYIPLMFLWGNALIGLATMLTPFFTDSETAMTVGWLFVFLVNLVGSPYVMRLQLHFFNEDSNVNMVGDPLISHVRRAAAVPESQWAGVMLLPSFAYFRALFFPTLFNSDGVGVTAGPKTYRGVELGMCAGPNPFCRSFLALTIQWILCTLLGMYFDRVLPTGPGTRLHPLFFLGGRFAQNKNHNREALVPEDPVAEPDVEDENLRAAKLAAQMGSSPFEGVVLHRLCKTYHGPQPVHALRYLSLVIPRDEVLCILAHNGAGKTTTFKLLTGVLSPTSGSAYVFGHCISDDMDGAYKRMGVAPQHDCLWEELTAAEHMCFYGRLRGLTGNALREAVRDGLSSVDLFTQWGRQVQKLSGGMRRRLTVGIALLGRPEFVILDEPSTGLDLVAREKMWGAIKRAQTDRAVVLTTHSLEEAEALSTRIAVMSDGVLKCVGTAAELKTRLGGGQHLTVSLARLHVDAFHARLAEVTGDAQVVTACGGNIEYVLPKGVCVSRVVELMRVVRDEFGLMDWAMHEASLEDVFLKVTRDSRGVNKALSSASESMEDIV